MTGSATGSGDWATGPGPLTFDAIGTRWQVMAGEDFDAGTVAVMRALVEDFDRTWSRFRPDSLVAELARGPGRFVFPDSAAELFDCYARLYEATDGAVTPLVGAAVAHLGYDADYSLRRRPGRAEVPRWADVLSVSGAVLTTTAPVVLDVGAAGKGFLVDQLDRLLAARGFGARVVDGSGDLVVRAQAAPVRVGLENPFDPATAVGVVELTDGALCGSAVTRRTWGPGLHHIVDPSTGEPVQGVVAAWALASTALWADGLATALFLVPPERLAARFAVDYVVLGADGAARFSPTLPGELFSDPG